MSHIEAPPFFALSCADQSVVGNLSLSKSAATKLTALAAQEGRATISLRVVVSGGGCYGMQYHFEVNTPKQPNEFTFRHDTIEIFIDEISLNLLNDSLIDFTEDLMGSAFVIKNPNAVSSCGCGTSFSVV
jgi:iron-sulfur cluster insertion protein